MPISITATTIIAVLSRLPSTMDTIRRVATTRRTLFQVTIIPALRASLIGAEAVFDPEIKVAFDRQAKFTAYILNLAEHEVAEFWTAHADRERIEVVPFFARTAILDQLGQQLVGDQRFGTGKRRVMTRSPAPIR